MKSRQHDQALSRRPYNTILSVLERYYLELQEMSGKVGSYARHSLLVACLLGQYFSLVCDACKVPTSAVQGYHAGPNSGHDSVSSAKSEGIFRRCHLQLLCKLDAFQAGQAMVLLHTGAPRVPGHQFQGDHCLLAMRLRPATALQACLVA